MIKTPKYNFKSFDKKIFTLFKHLWKAIFQTQNDSNYLNEYLKPQVIVLKNLRNGLNNVRSFFNNHKILFARNTLFGSRIC